MMKKKCVALLLVFALCLSLMPAAFAVDTGVTDSAFNDFAPIGSTYNACDGNFAQTAYGTVKLDETTTTATDKGYMQYMITGGVATPTAYWAPVIHSNSNPDAVRASVSTVTEGGIAYLVVTFEKGTVEGNATIRVDYTVSTGTITGGIGVGSDIVYVTGSLVYNAANGNGGSTPSTKPNPPTASDVADFYSDADRALLIKCREDETHNGYVRRLSADGYTIGEVEAFAGNASLSASEWLWY